MSGFSVSNCHLVGQDWDVQYFLDPNTLLHISQDRDSIIYPSYLRVDLSADLHETKLVGHIVSFDRVLQFEEDSSHRIQRSYTERQTQKEEDSDGYSPDESELSDMLGPLPDLSKHALIPGSSFNQSHHDALRQVGLATYAPLVAIKDIDLDNEPIILANDEIWRPKFQRSDGKRLMTNEGLLHDLEAFDGVLGGLLHPQDIKEWIDLDDHDFALQQTHHLISGEISRLFDKIDALSLERKNALLEMVQLKNDVGRVEKEKKDQYDACCTQIFKESAKQF
ncbi:hypothetical protein GBA52_003724 [Prunus armeniaca]|nr:hypothetical protein GBA52_003724 [Prunus armeniaca]